MPLVLLSGCLATVLDREGFPEGPGGDPVCGDGVQQRDEECDRGERNGTGVGCSNNCNIAEDCQQNELRTCVTPFKAIVCRDLKWELEADCGDVGRQCVRGDCVQVPDCDDDGAAACAGEFVIVCFEEHWHPGHNCADSELRCVDGACVVGSDGEGEGEGVVGDEGEGEAACDSLGRAAERDDVCDGVDDDCDGEVDEDVGISVMAPVRLTDPAELGGKEGLGAAWTGTGFAVSWFDHALGNPSLMLAVHPEEGQARRRELEADVAAPGANPRRSYVAHGLNAGYAVSATHGVRGELGQKQWTIGEGLDGVRVTRAGTARLWGVESDGSAFAVAYGEDLGSHSVVVRALSANAGWGALTNTVSPSGVPKVGAIDRMPGGFVVAVTAADGDDSYVGIHRFDGGLVSIDPVAALNPTERGSETTSLDVAWSNPGNEAAVALVDQLQGDRRELVLIRGLAQVRSEVLVAMVLPSATVSLDSGNRGHGLVWPDSREEGDGLYAALYQADDEPAAGPHLLTEGDGSARHPIVMWTGEDFGVVYLDTDGVTGSDDIWLLRWRNGCDE